MTKLGWVALGEGLFEQQPASSSAEGVGRKGGTRWATQRDWGVQVEAAFVVCAQHFPQMAEGATVAGCIFDFFGEVVPTDDEVL
ncbi:unannotated protein [freshwater metagenome]|uniref:Unannotated protein n=1 Tax=freshwater metagenome TaxID=449393 RepID=A0A6J6N0U1_9ZZZZ